MEGEEGEGLRLSKRFNDKAIGSGEVDYKTKAGTAWSHSYLNQKPWHPLSYPNQRRKWIAEQVNAERERRSADVAREYAQEQEFFRQTALVSKKEKEKMEMMKAVSFMYVRPPGYNAESAKAAEIADEKRKQDQSDPTQGSSIDGACTLVPPEPKDHSAEQKKKPRPKDVFGRPLPTEEEFGVLKNAPRLETGVAGRVKPFAIEVRNVKCVRCGTYGHQSGDRECPLKDAIMPNEESRLKRDDPLTAILAHTDPTEPLKWELKQKPGMSPPRGGFNPDDPNHQIVSEVIFDEYGGFLGADNVPDLLTNFSAGKSRRKKSSRKQRRGRDEKDRSTSPQKNRDGKYWKDKKRHKKHDRSYSRSSDDSEVDEKHNKRSRHKHSYPSNDSDMDRQVDKELHYRNGRKPSYSSKHSDVDRLNRSKRNKQSYSSDSERIKRHRRERSRQGRSHAHSSDDSDLRDSEGVMYHGRERSRQDHSRGHSSDDSNSSNAEGIKCHRRERSRQNHSRAHSSNDSGSSGSQDIKRHRRERSGQYPSHVHSSNDSGSSDSEGIKRHRCERSRQGRARAYSTDDSDCGGRQRSKHRY